MILVIAPHPDDDIICCGGIISKYNSNTKVVFVTDGSRGSPIPEERGEKLALKRINEAYNALGTLGLKDKDRIVFLNNEDGKVSLSRYKVYNQLAEIILEDEKRFQAIYFPSPADVHPDHSEVGKIILKIFKHHKLKDLDLYMYIVHNPPLLPRKLNDLYKEITLLRIKLKYSYKCFKVDNMSLKEQALRKHESQFKYFDKNIKRIALSSYECFYYKKCVA